MLLPSIFKNPNIDKRTSHAKLNEPEFACWTKETEWMDATMVMKDSIVVVVLSKRSIYMHHLTRHIDQPDYIDVAEYNLDTIQGAENNHMDEYDIYAARAFVIGPAKESGNETLAMYCEKLAETIELEPLNAESRATLITYDPHDTQIADGVGTVEATFSPKIDNPTLYLNGVKVGETEYKGRA